MFTVEANVTFILDNNIILHGHRQNSESPMVDVNGGVFKMNAGSTITGNNGSGVFISRGTFEMMGGTISDNSGNTNVRSTDFSGSSGGGVSLYRGTFIMNDGIITRNSAINGGGVHIFKDVIGREQEFIMRGGIISENTATRGGGVCLENFASFTMRGGTIANNTAREYGGGVYMKSTHFEKTGGIITGYSNEPDNGNAVRDETGIIARRGHAIFVDGLGLASSSNLRKESTSGLRNNMSVIGSGPARKTTGSWDQ